MIIDLPTSPKEADSFFKNKDIDPVLADRSAMGWVEQFNLLDNPEAPFNQIVKDKKTELKDALGLYKTWNESRGVKPFASQKYAGTERRELNFAKNIPKWNRLFSDDSFESALEERGLKSKYDELLKLTGEGSQEAVRNNFRRKLFVGEIAGEPNDVNQARIAKGLLGIDDPDDDFFVSSAKKWVAGTISNQKIATDSYEMGIDAFIADNAEAFNEKLKERRSVSAIAEESFVKGYNSLMDGDGKAMLFQASKIVAKAKAEGERGLFEQKKDLPVASIGLIAEFYAKPGGREKFLMILNNKIKQESSKTDVSFVTKFTKQVARFFESEIGARGRDNLRRNIEESDRSLFFPDDPDSRNFETVNGRKVAKKLSGKEKAYFRNVQQVSADISNVKQAVSQIDGESWFSTMILDQSGTLAQMPLIMNPVGFYTRYQSQRQLDTEEILAQDSDISYDEARGMARFSAGMNVFSERLATGFFLKKFPTIKNATLKIKGVSPVSAAQAFRRAGVAAASITGAEYLQESFQEATLPLTLDLFNSLNEEMPEGDWDQFKMWDQRRFLAVLPLAILGGGGQAARDRISTAELGKVLLAKNDVMASGRSEKQAQEVAELAMTDPDAALALYKKQGESMSREEQETLGNEAMRNVYSEQLGEEFAAMPIARQTEDGKFSLDFQDGRREEYDSVAERDQALENWSKEEFFQTREAMEAFAEMAKERVEGQADFKIKRPRTFQDLADQGVETEANLKKAIGVYYSQMGEVAPDKIDLANYIEEGSIRLKKDLSGFAVRLAQGANPITVAEEFSEGFIRRAVGLGETSFDEVKALLDEFGEMSGIQMTEGYDIDPERAVIEGFSKFAKAYALQGKYDMLPKETQSWMSKAWAVMENSNNIPGVLKAFSELFSKMFKAVYDVAKAIEFHRAKGAGIDPDLESMALRALGFDEKGYNERMQEKSQQEVIEEVYGPDFSIREDKAEAGKEQVGEDGIKEVVTPDESTVPGTLAPTRPVEEIIPDENAPEIPWDMSTFGIAPKTDDKSFPLLNEKLSKQLLKETDVVGAIHIDRAGIGEIDGIPIQGGARFPSIKENVEKGIAWAFNSVSVASDVLTRAREANGYIKLILMSEGNVVGNKTFATIWLNRVGKIVKDKTVLDAVLTEFHKIRKSAIKSKITNKRREEAKKVKEGKKVTPTPEENIAKYDRKGESVETFAQLKKFLLKMPQSNRASYYFKRQTQSEDTSNRKKGQTVYGKLLGEKFSKKYGLPDASELVDKMEDPSFKGMKIGDVVALIKIDPDSEVMTAKEAGVPEHLSYGYVVKGKPFARMKKIRNVDEDYPSIKGKIMSQGSKQYPAKDYASFSIGRAQDAKGYETLLEDVNSATKEWSRTNEAYELAQTDSEMQDDVIYELERDGIDIQTEDGARKLEEAIAKINYGDTKEGVLEALQYAKDEAESGVKKALENFLKPMGYEIDALSTGSPSSFYFEIAPDFDTQEWLEENFPDFEIEEAKGKIRFSDHSKTSSRYDAPDVNIQPGESIETQFNNLFNRLPNLTAMQDTFAIRPVAQYGAITKLEKKILSDRVNIGKRLEAKLEADEQNWNNAKKSGNQEEIERAAQQVMRRTQAYMEVLPDYPMGPTISKAQDLAEKVLVGSIEITEGIKIVDENARYSGLPIKLPSWLSNLKVADWVKRNLRARGDLTPDQFKIKLASEAITLTELKRAELINSRLKKAVKKESLVAPNPEGVLMEDFLMKRVQDALVMDGSVNVTEAINKLPKSLQSVTKEMRVHVDSLSREMIKKGIAKGDLADVFQRNIGSYLNRSYRRFTRPEKWKHEVSEESKKNAMQWLEDNLPAEAFSGDVSKEDQLEGYVDTLLTDSVSGGFTDQMNWLLGQKHIGNLIARKKVPVELRELWGEYKRGDENYMTSVRKMATQIGNHTMLTEFLKNGLNTEIFSTPRKGFSKQISSKGNEMLSPLDGYYVSEGMSQALIDFSESGETTAYWLKLWLKFNSVAKVTKTIYNPTTHARNFLSNFVYVGANGNLFEYLNIDTVKMSATINYKEIFKSWETTKDVEDRILHYIRLGIMQQGAVSQEFKDILNDFSAGDVDIDEYTQNSAKRFAKAGLKKIESLYQAEDDFHKIVSYEAERAKLAKAKPEWKSDKLDAEAAQIVRDTMPDYSQVPNAVKMLRRVPFIGTFTSFTSEVIRNNTNIIQRAKFEMSDPELRSIGAKRLSSFAVAHSIPLAGAYFLASMFGVDDEEDEATRAIAAPWDKYAQLLYVGRTPSGDPQYINISYTDPFSVFKTPIFVSQQDGFSPVSVAKGILMGLEPFYGEEIGTAALLDIRENENEKIYNPNSDAWTITKDISEHILKAVEPGVVRSTKRIYEAATGKETDYGMKLDTKTEVIAVLSGQRITSIDRKRAIFHRNNDFQDALRSSTYRFKAAWRNKNVDKKELSKAYDQYKKDNEKAYSEFQDALQAVSRLGLTEEQILLETTKGKDNTETAKRLLNLLRAPAGETPMPDKKFTKSQIKEIEEKGRKEILEEVAPELFD